MAKKKCNKQVEIYSNDGNEVLTLKCTKSIADERMEKKYPHTSHIAEATARSGVRVQVLWAEEKEAHG